MNKIILAAAAALMVTGVSFAGDVSHSDCECKKNAPKWEVGASMWQPELTGHIKVGNAAVGNIDKIDFEKDTSIDDDDVFGLTLNYNLTKRTTLEFTWNDMEHSGNVSGLTNKFEFDGKVYDANGKLHLGIENTWYNLSVARTFVDQRDDCRKSLMVRGRFGIKVNDAEASVSGEVTTLTTTVRESNSWSETFPVPYIGFDASSQITDILGVKVALNWLKADVSDYDVSYRDFNMNVALRLNRACKNSELYLLAGYRNVKYDVEGDGNDLILDYSGPTIALDYRF